MGAFVEEGAVPYVSQHLASVLFTAFVRRGEMQQLGRLCAGRPPEPFGSAQQAGGPFGVSLLRRCDPAEYFQAVGRTPLITQGLPGSQRLPDQPCRSR